MMLEPIDRLGSLLRELLPANESKQWFLPDIGMLTMCAVCIVLEAGRRIYYSNIVHKKLKNSQ